MKNPTFTLIKARLNSRSCLINTLEGIASKNESDNFDVDLYNTSSFLLKFANNTKTSKALAKTTNCYFPKMPIILLLLIQSILFASSSFISIPAGSFQMGSEEGNRDESPVRSVKIHTFEMSKTEVTIGEYLRCMADGACSTPTWWTQGYFESTSDTLTPSQQMQLPITGVSWAQAMEYCAWQGPNYRLPTEAEWEFAAGGFKGYQYPWGMDAEGYNVFQANRLNPVGSKPASILGLHDMEGSVWEWVYDCYDALESDGSCKRHVTKGGSWSEHIWNLRIANKSYGLTSQGYKTLGFRVLRYAR